MWDCGHPGHPPFRIILMRRLPMARRPAGLLLLLALPLARCNSLFYKTLPTLGKEKRDTLISRVKDAKKRSGANQREAQDHHGAVPGPHWLSVGFARKVLAQLKPRRRRHPGRQTPRQDPAHRPEPRLLNPQKVWLQLPGATGEFLNKEGNRGKRESTGKPS